MAAEEARAGLQARAEQQARAAWEQLAAARQEPDDVVTDAQTRTAGAESQAGQDAAEPDRADDA